MFRIYFFRLSNNKVERFPSGPTIEEEYLATLKNESGSMYSGIYCHHPTCTLPDHIVGWSEHQGDYFACPRQFDPELHRLLDPRSINRLTLPPFNHWNETQGWFLGQLNVFIPSIVFPAADECTSRPPRVSGYDI
jgi:hypothetical protein